MSERQMFALLHELWNDFQHPNFVWEVFRVGPDSGRFLVAVVHVAGT